MVQGNRWLNIAIITTALGAPALAAIVQLVLLRRLKRRGMHVPGVVSVISAGFQSRDGDFNRYVAEAQFEVDGREFRITLPMYTRPSFYNDGEVVPVYYYPDRPERGRVVCLREYMKYILMAGVCGTLAIGFDCLILIAK